MSTTTRSNADAFNMTRQSGMSHHSCYRKRQNNLVAHGRCRRWGLQQRQLRRRQSHSAKRLVFDPSWGWRRFANSKEVALTDKATALQSSNSLQPGRTSDSAIEILSSDDEEESDSWHVKPTRKVARDAPVLSTTDASGAAVSLRHSVDETNRAKHPPANCDPECPKAAAVASLLALRFQQGRPLHSQLD